MIKSLRVSDKTVRKFKSAKSWRYSTIDSLSGLLLEQTKKDGTQIPLNIDTRESVALEQGSNAAKVKIKFGKNIKDRFYPEEHDFHNPATELKNTDGSYYRTVYSSIKHLFYNTYGIYDNEEDIKNPLMVFGSEVGHYKTSGDTGDVLRDNSDRYETRRLTDNVLVIEFTNSQFGEKIKPNNFKIVDYSSPYGTIEIVDDGCTNLVVSNSSFNEITEISHSNSNKIEAPELSPTFDADTLSFGKNIVADGDYVLSGSPMDQDSPSDFLSGNASLFKYDKEKAQFRRIRKFKCPFTQEGLLYESKQNSSGFLVTELGNLVAAEDYSLNDNFGGAVELRNGTCAIGSSRSHITSACNESRQGHVFIYDINKGGTEHWGLVNILEGTPGSEFGASISVSGNHMAIGAPGMYHCEGAIYIFEKTVRDKTTPWYRISDSHDDFCFNERSDNFLGFPVCDKLKELNENLHRWKIESATPDEYPLTYFSEDEDICEELEIVTFKDESISSQGYDTKLPVSKYHQFEEGRYSPNYAEGDVTWQLVTIVRHPGTNMLGQKVKLQGNLLISSTPDTKTQDVYVFRKRQSQTSECELWEHTQKINHDRIYNYDRGGLSLGDGIAHVDYDIKGNSITIRVTDKPLTVDVSPGFVWNLNKVFGTGEDIYKTKIKHGGVVNTTNEVTISDLAQGDHVVYIGRYYQNELVGNPTALTISINPTIIEPTLVDRSIQVKYPFSYKLPPQQNFGISLETNGVHLFIGDDSDRMYTDSDFNSVFKKNFVSGAVHFYKIEDTSVDFIKKIYEEDDDEKRYSNRFGCSLSLLGKDILIGSPCIEQTKISIIDNGKSFVIPDFSHGVDNNEETTFIVGQSLFTKFEHKFVGDGYVDLKLMIDVASIDALSIESIDDFELKASFLSEEPSVVDGKHGSLTRGIYRDKTDYDGKNIIFHLKINGHDFDPDEEVEFVYYVHRNSVQGTATYCKISGENEITKIKNIKTIKQRNGVMGSYGTSVALSSEFIFVGEPVIGDWPIDQIGGFDAETFVSFDGCSHVFTSAGDIAWGNLEKQDIFVEGKVISYDIRTIRDNVRIHVGNIFYKNGIAVVTEMGNYFKDMLTKGGRRGFEITYDGINSIFENEILCKVNPNEFNVSTNPTSVTYSDVPFDVTSNQKFDIIDVSYIYRYIMGTFRRLVVEQDETEEVPDSLVLEQDTTWPNEDVLLSESEDVILMNTLMNITKDNSLNTEEELKILESIDRLYNMGKDGLDIDGDGVVSANDAKLLARYFVGRKGNALVDGLINPLDTSITRPKPYEIIQYLDIKTGKDRGRRIMDGFLEYDNNDRDDRVGSYLAPYATTIGLYDGPDLVMTAKLGSPVKIVPNYPVNFLIKYDS
jgi:hypothetical protein